MLMPRRSLRPGAMGPTNELLNPSNIRIPQYVDRKEHSMQSPTMEVILTLWTDLLLD